jgi:hypothetical protein
MDSMTTPMIKTSAHEKVGLCLKEDGRVIVTSSKNQPLIYANYAD